MNKSVMLFAAIFLVFQPIVQSVGYAPIIITGQLLKDEQAISQAEIWMKAYQQGLELYESDIIFTNEQGLFAQVLSVPSDYEGDIQITIQVGEDTYVEVLYNVVSWHEYDIIIDLGHDDLGIKASGRSTQGTYQNPDLAQDIQNIIDGQMDTIEAYDLVVDDKVVPRGPIISNKSAEQSPTLEQPRLLVEPDKDESFLDWQLFAAIGLVLVLALIVFLLSRRVHQ